MQSSSVRHDPRTVLSARRAVISLVIGLLAGAMVALLGAPELWPLVAWILATGIVLSWVWRIIWPQDAAGTERRLAACIFRPGAGDVEFWCAAGTMKCRAWNAGAK